MCCALYFKNQDILLLGRPCGIYANVETDKPALSRYLSNRKCLRIAEVGEASAEREILTVLFSEGRNRLSSSLKTSVLDVVRCS